MEINFYFKFWFSCLSLRALPQFSIHMKIVFHLKTQRLGMRGSLSVKGAALQKFSIPEHLKSSFSNLDVTNKI